VKISELNSSPAQTNHICIITSPASYRPILLEEGDRRQRQGDRRQETETGDGGRQETGDGRWETGDGDRDRRQETGGNIYSAFATDFLISDS